MERAIRVTDKSECLQVVAASSMGGSDRARLSPQNFSQSAVRAGDVGPSAHPTCQLQVLSTYQAEHSHDLGP